MNIIDVTQKENRVILPVICDVKERNTFQKKILLYTLISNLLIKIITSVVLYDNDL